MGNTPSSGNLPKDSGIVTVHAAPQGNEIEAWKAAFKQLPEVRTLAPACGDSVWDALTVDAAVGAKGWALDPAPSVAAANHLTAWLAEVDSEVAAGQTRVRQQIEHVELTVDAALATCERSMAAMDRCLRRADEMQAFDGKLHELESCVAGLQEECTRLQLEAHRRGQNSLPVSSLARA